jgi:putative polyhydroxyalkanoate system protein
MADIEIHRVHNLGLKAARAAADKMAEQLGRKFDLKGDWEGNTLRFERPGVTGALAIDDKALKLSVTLGFLLKAMKGSIEGAVRQELDKLFVEKPVVTPAEPAPAVRKPGAAAQSTEKTKPKKAAPRPKKGG